MLLTARAPMQAVDVMAEFPNFQVWIEIKEFQPAEIEAMKKEGDQQKQVGYENCLCLPHKLR